ncbi:MFS transporter [Streptomyces thermolineatus]|uniref:MFS transporter n=1 Tax=Streptomyces thermolineatus TaxID=44033 RepID=UPI00384EEA2F
MERSLRYARLATFAFFALNGFLMGMWIVHIPAVEHRAGISHAVLGWLLLLLGGGALAGMRSTGPLTDRLGARAVVPAGAVLCSTALVLPGLATGPWTLGAALLVFGFGNGCLDVGMNTHAVQVERGYGRPVMSAFHAVFSVGGVLAALAGAGTLDRGWDAATTLTGASALGLAVTAVASRALLRPEPTGRPEHPSPGASDAPDASDPSAPDASGVTAPDSAPGAVPGTGAGPRRGVAARVRALALLALMLMLCEGVANDWSVLAVQDVLGAPAATAALAYGAFSTAMTVGRLLADRVAARLGPVAVVRHGALVGALGLAVAAVSPWVPLALAGWTVFGLGLSGCVPQLFSAAGHADPSAAGANVSRVAGLGYLGMLAGPAVIGPLTHLVPLNLTFFLPVALCLVAAAAAPVLRPRPAETAGSREPALPPASGR